MWEEGRFGVQVELCCWSCSTQPRRAPAPLPFSSRLPSLVQRGAAICLGQCKTGFSLSPRHESAMSQSLWHLWQSGELGLSPNCKCCFNQRSRFPTCGSLWPAPCSWLILWLAWFWILKKAQGKISPQNYGVWILHRAGFPCENPKVVSAYRYSQEAFLWAFQRVTEHSLQQFVLNFTRSFRVFCEFLCWLKLRLGSPPASCQVCDVKQLETSTAVCMKAAMENSWHTLITLLEWGLIHLSY